LDDVKAIIPEAQVTDDFRTEQAVDISGRRNLEAGKCLLGDTGAADEVTAFEDQDFATCPGQVSCRHQTVMTAPNDDRVVVCCHAKVPSGLAVVSQADLSFRPRRAKR